ncbi:TOBE domain-containing protein [Pseudohongiella spirulinae]|uniref:Transcriptional regulator, ModE family n=1 Tax=Pseudohongiella spirulinae TaxID=1249552 RepID=A0A0S2KFA3_9GAMM|nr:TOBE domain-containing protein [Pseudohongiella spirulinae]ALO47008.1 Transcriptional regulator, ModE family [Pseudohongiella spirulinae]
MSEEGLGSFVAPIALATRAGEISPRRLSLLVAVGETGSISRAAKAVGMTYKAAWDAVDIMNNLAGEPLVVVQHGGRGGGGAQLTPAGEGLVRNLSRLEQLQRDFMREVVSATGDITSLNLLQRMSMKSSARNILLGTVNKTTRGGINTEVSLQLRTGGELHATVTNESADDLALTPGREAMALIKASWIILAAADTLPRTSARNCLRGRVVRVQAGPVNAEVVLDLGDGVTLAAVITRGSLDEMDIKTDNEMFALIKSSHIILGVDS